MIRQASRCTQEAHLRAAEALPAIVGSVVGAILSFLGKAVGLLAEDTWAIIVFIAGLIGEWVM